MNTSALKIKSQDISALIFDFDGVIVDSLSAHLNAWDAALKKLVGGSLGKDAWIQLRGKATRQIAQILCQDYPGLDQNTLILSKSSLLASNPQDVPLFRGVKEIFKALDQKKVLYGIGSNAPREFVRSVVKAHSLPCPVVLGYEDVTNPKPAPDLFLLVAKKLGVPVGQHSKCLVFEDSTHGLEAAISAGMQAIGVSSQHDEAVLREAGASIVVANVADFLFDIISG